jgi:hypothetical protein
LLSFFLLLNTIHLNMKHIVLALAFAGLTVGLHAQIPPEEMTKDILNCRWWRALTSDGLKAGFVAGFYTAVIASTDITLIVSTRTPASYGETVKGLDGLCAVPENGPLPLHSMIIIFARKSRGDSEQEINEMLQGFRKQVAEWKDKR